MGKTVPAEDMNRIRRCMFIETQEQLDEFSRWCEKSEHKVVRGEAESADMLIYTGYSLV